jgi:hypothetical protein
MLGTGTQLDPYQITTVAEFRSMNDSTAYFKLMNDLDVNDSEWATGWTEVTIAFKELDGDGHEIRNINQSGGSYAIYYDVKYQGSSKIKNVSFTNVTLNGVANFMYFSGTDNITGNRVWTLDGVSLSIACNNVTSIFNSDNINFHTINITNSAMTISGRLQTIGVVKAITVINNLMINLDNAIFYSTNNSHILGTASTSNRFNKIAILGTASFDHAKTSWFQYGYANQVFSCYIAVKIIGTIKPTYFSDTPASVCFYDADLYGGSMTSKTKLHALTTAQCKNKDYLNSIGFVVV